MKNFKILLSLLLITGYSMGQNFKGSVLVQNGTVLTVGHGTLEDTDVLIRNGKITRIGKDLSTPRDVKTIDATGMYIMPGIIDAHSHLAGGTNEATSPVTPEVWIGDALNPLDIGIYRALAGGVTVSHSMHGSANVIGGQNETIKHHYGTSNPDDIRMQGAPRTIKFALGENPTRVHGRGNKVNPSSRMGVEQIFRKSFSEAQDYKAEWDAYNAAKSKKGSRTVPPMYSRRLETLADVLDGKILIHCHSYRSDEILMMMEVLKDFGVTKITFQHVNEGYKVAPELAEFGATASVFSDWWAYKFEVYYSTAYNAAILTRNGVITSINSDSGELIRHLYHEAAKSQRYGDLTDDEALALITINPAKQLGIDSRVGSIEKGKDGDLAIFNNHPLSVYAIPQKTIVDGIVRFDIEKDPDDMRIYVDPEQPVEADYEFDDHQGCLEGIISLEDLMYDE